MRGVSCGDECGEEVLMRKMWSKTEKNKRESFIV